MVMGQLFGKEFERNGTLQARIFRLVHHAHPATTQLLQDAVVRDRLADHGKKTHALGSILVTLIVMATRAEQWSATTKTHRRGCGCRPGNDCQAKSSALL